MSRITSVKDKIPKKASWPGFLASGKDSRTKVVLARKLGKQGLGSTPELRAVHLKAPFVLRMRAMCLSRHAFDPYRSATESLFP